MSLALLDLYNSVVTVIAGIGLVYLLYSGRYVIGYRRFFLIITFGLLVSLVGGPSLLFIPMAGRHLIHGTATLFIAIGLYDLVRTELGVHPDWTEILFERPEEFERHATLAGADQTDD